MTCRYETSDLYPDILWDTVDKRWISKSALGRNSFDTFDTRDGSGFSENDWPEPKPLPDGLLPVAMFNRAFLPKAIAPWVMDISERMQCAPEFVAVPAIIALGAVIGRKVGIRPQRRTDWTEVPNLWGCIVGRPGVLKSPAMAEAMKPLQRLEAEARKEHDAALKDYEREAELIKIRREEAAKAARKAIKGGVPPVVDDAAEPEEPRAKRYLVIDASYEALGAAMADNPQGVLAFRDELISLLKTLDREEFCAARGFFLTAWNGTSGYTFDRIIRGLTYIDAACLSLVGSTQPGRLAEYIRRANAGGAGDDGLLQRFGMLVWPDQSGDWKEVDCYPDGGARMAAWDIFMRLDGLDAQAIGAEHDEYSSLPFLRFDGDAQGIFAEWRAQLERRLRSAEMSPALESHLAKYRKLVPALALINHLADSGFGAVPEVATLRALSFAEYLETHARRAYGSGLNAETAAAKAVLKRIRKGDLQDGFTLRDALRAHWAALTERGQVQAGLELLCDFGWLRQDKRQTGGRPSTPYAINPRARQ